MEIHNLNDTYKHLLDLPSPEEIAQAVTTIPDSMAQSYEKDVIAQSLAQFGIKHLTSQNLKVYMAGYMHGAGAQVQSRSVFMVVFTILNKLLYCKVADEQEAVRKAGQNIGLTE